MTATMQRSLDLSAATLREPLGPTAEGLSSATFERVVIDGGRVRTGRDAVVWARDAVALGAGEVLLNSIDRDGTKLGFDLEMTAAVAAAVDVPVIASGGASSATDFVTLFARSGADAALAASIFHYGELSVGDVKEALAAAGVPVRPRERVLA